MTHIITLKCGTPVYVYTHKTIRTYTLIHYLSVRCIINFHCQPSIRVTLFGSPLYYQSSLSTPYTRKSHNQPVRCITNVHCQSLIRVALSASLLYYQRSLSATYNSHIICQSVVQYYPHHASPIHQRITPHACFASFR